MESWKLDCAWALQRKTLHSLPVALSGTLSPVRFQGGNHRIAAIFRNSGGNAARVSQQPRLGGGEGGIRTLGTGLNGARADVCVSYRESIFYQETEGLMPLRRWGKPVQFPVQSMGESLAILRLKVVTTTPLKRPRCFVPDCVRAAQSKSEKYLRR